MWKLSCVPVRPTVCPLSTHLHLSMFIAVHLWSGSRSLASVTPSISDLHWDSSQLSCCCSMSWGSCSFGTTGPTLSCVPTHHRRYRFWGGPFRALDLGQGASRAGQSTGSMLSTPQGELSSTALARSPSATLSWRKGHLSCSYAVRAACLHPCLQSQLHSCSHDPRVTSPGGSSPLHPCHLMVAEWQGQLSHALTLRVSSPAPSHPR